MAATTMTARELLTKVFQGEQTLTPELLSCENDFAMHLMRYPNDTNFVAARKPGVNYGELICMEESCYSEIELSPNPNLPDGGIGRGFGWLFKYWEHIDSSPEHKAARGARVIRDKQIKSEMPPDAWTPKVKKTSSSSGASSTAASGYASGSGIKAEDRVFGGYDGTPRASTSGSSSKSNTKKRPSDPLYRSSVRGMLTDDDADLARDKKPKLEATPGVLAERRNEPQAGAAPVIVPLQPTIAEQNAYKEAKSALERYELLAEDLRTRPTAQRDAGFYAQLDLLNGHIAKQRQIIENSKKRFGAAIEPVVQPRPAAAAAAMPGAFPGAVGGYAAAMDPAAAVLARLSGSRNAANDDSDDEAMWNNFAPVTHEDFDHFIKAALEGEGFEGNENVNAAAAAIGLKSQKEPIQHMTVDLMPHQIIACAWMKEREADKTFGGILADEMGLGKTIEAIANCLINPSADPEEKTTLVVAPLALLNQWEAELTDKVERGHLSICKYHGPERSKYSAKKLRKFDFVLTTYGTLVTDFADEENLEKKAKKAAKKADNPEAWEDFLAPHEDGPLFKMGFYRVILDEAQYIRNKATKVSRAVTRIDALYRWALTGTPVTNSLADLYPLFRFLQLKPWYDWARYRENVIHYEKKNPEIAGRKAQAILRTCMLRRKKDSKLDGKNLIELPPRNVELRELEFSEEERDIYTAIEGKAQAKFNRFLRQGTVLKNYAHILLLILRLRQICFHPALVADAEKTAEHQEEAKEAVKDEAKRAKNEVGKAFVDKIRKMRLDAAVERCNAEQQGTDAAGDECAICMEDFHESEQGGAVTRCAHIFCYTCLVDVINAEQRGDHDEEGADKKCKADQRPCPICRQPCGLKDIFKLAAFEPTDEELCTAANMEIDREEDDEDDTLGGFIVPDHEEDDDDFGKSVSKKKPKQPNRAIIQDSDDEEQAEQSEAEEEPAPRKDKGKGKQKEKPVYELKFIKELEPSTKMIWAEKEVERMLKENPDDKVIIISSFVSALDMMDIYLESKGHRTVRYQGDMSITEREESIRILKKSKKCRIMLLSLKCGGVGLTLTRANRVISLDLAWSNAVENQAFDRVHRIGQKKDVFVNRLTIKDTIEQRILELQKKKQGLADASLGEGGTYKMGKLTVADLAALFGLNVRGQRV
ncbi:hypothetical protein JCM10049v2_000456 [Rhodotorula toruloides]